MPAVPYMQSIVKWLSRGLVATGAFWLAFGLLFLGLKALVALIPCTGEDCGREFDPTLIVAPAIGLALLLPGVGLRRLGRRAETTSLNEAARVAHLRASGRRALATVLGHKGSRGHFRDGLTGPIRFRHEHVVEVCPDDAAPFRIRLTALRGTRLPDGHQLWVCYDPGDPQGAVPYEPLDETVRV